MNKNNISQTFIILDILKHVIKRLSLKTIEKHIKHFFLMKPIETNLCCLIKNNNKTNKKQTKTMNYSILTKNNILKTQLLR